MNYVVFGIHLARACFRSTDFGHFNLNDSRLYAKPFLEGICILHSGVGFARVNIIGKR